MASSRLTVLVVDDSEDSREVLQRTLGAHGYEVVSVAGVEEAISLLERRPVDIVVTDQRMPGLSGLDLVRHVRENYSEVEVLVVTGYPSIESAVKAVKSGAEAFLAKPFTDQELLDAVRAAGEKLSARRAIRGGGDLRAPLRPGLLGECEAMRRVIHAVEKAAATAAPVLVLGEPGTGKELVARALHYNGPREKGPFVTSRLAAVPEDAREAELFGGPASPGAFAAAAGGTLYLQGLEGLSLGLQSRLSEWLQARASRAQGQEPRLVAGAGPNLLSLVKKGSFREDLFYRISAVTVELPPLRERGEDVLLLARHFAARYAAEAGRPAPTFTDRATAVLREHGWPGNVRELDALMQRLVLVAPGAQVDAPDLPALMRYSALRERALARSLAEVEDEHIREVLASVQGNRTRAAEILGIDRKTLREKVKRSERS